MYYSPLIDDKEVEKMMHKEVVDTHRVTCEKQERLAVVTLNYPEKRNAIGKAMRDKILHHYREWVDNPDVYTILVESNHPEFFSAGADIIEILEARERSLRDSIQLLGGEYETIWTIDCMTKPVISLINGKVMGGGVGITQHGTHIVAGENYAWSMPEVKIGLFPDVGITRLLANMPGAIGMYLGLTGQAINRDDARYLDLIEHSIDSDQFENIKQQLREAIPVDRLLDDLTQKPGNSQLEELEPLITKTFSQPTVEAIITALEEIRGEHQPWAEAALEDMKAASPTSLKLTKLAIERMKGLPLEAALAQDFTLVGHCLKNHDFPHAINARMREKTTPTWQPDNLAAVSMDEIDEYFTPVVEDVLNLPPRELGVDK
ncbi:MAG: 3-hydroxyisobutyryl-CoA hydrolase [Rhodomicrobium sp.]|nr:MAG: 3-hydroxyisobutyryl-CoA hydrolase [Rhodomicrobium sp.]